MEKKILLFESRDLCYESNRYFTECMQEAFEKNGYRTKICDLSAGMEEKLEDLLERQEQYLAAFDFNSLLPRLELEDETPYLEKFRVPFFNYLVDHPLYHHAGLKRSFPNYNVLCIDLCHSAYLRKYYPHLGGVYTMPMGGMAAERRGSWDEKRFDLLFLGTYEPEDELCAQLAGYPGQKRREVSAMIELMEADAGLTQEEALENYLRDTGEKLSGQEFARRLNQDYMADKYLRNKRRRHQVLAAARAKVPFTVIGHGWDALGELEKSHIIRHSGVGFAASLQMLADAKMLLNTTPGFHGGLHDRVYSAMLNEAVCLTERTGFAESELCDGREAVLYDCADMQSLTGIIEELYGQSQRLREIAAEARKRAEERDTWECRIKKLSLLPCLADGLRK